MISAFLKKRFRLPPQASVIAVDERKKNVPFVIFVIQCFPKYIMFIRSSLYAN
jgi:hypothetical protein